MASCFMETFDRVPVNGLIRYYAERLDTLPQGRTWDAFNADMDGAFASYERNILIELAKFGYKIAPLDFRTAIFAGLPI